MESHTHCKPAITTRLMCVCVSACQCLSAFQCASWACAYDSVKIGVTQMHAHDESVYWQTNLHTRAHTHTHWPPQYTQTHINRHPASHIHHTHTHHRHLHKQNCRPTTTYSDTPPPSPTLSISPPYTHTQYQRPTTNINTIRLGLDDIMAWMTARLPALLVWL